MIGNLNDVEVVLDDDHGITLIGELLKDRDELIDVVEVQAGRRFIQDIYGATRSAAGELLGELDALGPRRPARVVAL